MKINRSELSLLIAVFSAPLFALICSVLQSVALLADYDASTGYYAYGSALFRTVPILLAAAAGLLLVATLFARRKATPAPDTNTLPVLFSGAFLILSLVAITAVLLLTLSKGVEGGERFFLILIALAAISSFIYMALTLCGKLASRLRLSLSVAPILYALFSAMYLYFVPNIQINAPVKLLNILALLAIALFALSECRCVIGRAKPALHLFTTACAAVLTATASIPSLIYTAVRLSTPLFSLSTVDDFVIFAFFLYIMARLFALLPVKHAPALHGMVDTFLAREGEEEPDTEGELAQESMDFSEEADEGEKEREE